MPDSPTPNHEWPADLRPAKVRIARQTDQLDALKRFYCEGLGLPILSEFGGHGAYTGLIVGLPGHTYHLEFIQHAEGSPGDAPNEESLLVFYLADMAAVRRITSKLTGMGYAQVEAENPWWERHHAITIEDPDRWRVVFFPEQQPE